MQFSFAALALLAIGASAQTTVVKAPCGTSCPTAPADKTISRSYAAASEGTICPSLLVSSISGNGTSPAATGAPKAPGSVFTGGANHVAGSVGAAVAVVAVAFAL